VDDRSSAYGSAGRSPNFRVEIIDLLRQCHALLTDDYAVQVALVLQLVSERYEKGSIILTSNKSYGDWGATGSDVNPLRTYGTFGPILSLLQFVSKSPGDVTWGWWEKSANGHRAVFRYRIAGIPTLDLVGCCYPNGSKDARVGISAGTHGELVIDSGTGAILRVQTESELPGFVPTKRSDMMVSYGPVEIGGKTYIMLQRSVSIWRGRSAATLLQRRRFFNGMTGSLLGDHTKRR
jgi:hypothetical protein